MGEGEGWIKPLLGQAKLLIKLLGVGSEKKSPAHRWLVAMTLSE